MLFRLGGPPAAGHPAGQGHRALPGHAALGRRLRQARQPSQGSKEYTKLTSSIWLKDHAPNVKITDLLLSHFLIGDVIMLRYIK